MFDWASFFSGVLGALLGAGGTVGVVLLQSRRETRSELREQVAAVSDALHHLAVASEHEAGVTPVALAELVTPPWRVISRFSSHLGRKDAAVAEWASEAVALMVTINSVEGRVSVASRVEGTLARWAAGRMKSSWFAKSENALTVW